MNRKISKTIALIIIHVFFIIGYAHASNFLSPEVQINNQIIKGAFIKNLFPLKPQSKIATHVSTNFLFDDKISFGIGNRGRF